MKKILICIPSYEGKLSLKMNLFKDSLIVPEGYSITYTYFHRTLIDIARNIAVQDSIDKKYDYLFFIDDDTIPEKDVLVNLLGDNLGIVSGLYKERGGKRRPLIYKKYRDTYHNINKIVKSLGVIQKIDACGAGCLLIKVDILKDMVDRYGQGLFKFKEVSEDIEFCRKATDMGYSIYVDTRCRCTHIGEPEMIRVTEDDFVLNSKVKVSVIFNHESYYNGKIIENFKENIETTIVNNSYLTKEIIESAKGEYIIFIGGNIEIPYGLDECMIQGLEEADIVGPITIKDKELIFRNDNVVTRCWMMKKSELLKYLPIPTNIKDFTLYRKLKENRGVCGLLDAKIRLYE